MYYGTKAVAGHNHDEVYDWLHSIDQMGPFRKKEVALSIGLKMIADGCVRVDKQYDMPDDVFRYTFVAKPFKKEMKLP